MLRRQKQRLQFGFSLLEMLLVVAIMLVITAIAIPLVSNAVDQVRLSESATDYANLLQRARMQAVKDDRYYYVRFDASATPPRAWIDTNADGNYTAGEPMITFSDHVAPQSYGSGPGVSNLKSQFLPSTAQNTVATTSTPTFGPRGLPCTESSSTCPYLDATGKPTSYITFIQNSSNSKWEAITVNPASRIRRWSYEGSAWSPLN